MRTSIQPNNCKGFCKMGLECLSFMLNRGQNYKSHSFNPRNFSTRVESDESIQIRLRCHHGVWGVGGGAAGSRNHGGLRLCRRRRCEQIQSDKSENFISVRRRPSPCVRKEGGGAGKLT